MCITIEILNVSALWSSVIQSFYSEQHVIYHSLNQSQIGQLCHCKFLWVHITLFYSYVWQKARDIREIFALFGNAATDKIV